MKTKSKNIGLAVSLSAGLFTLATATPLARAATVTHLFTGWYGVEAGTTVFKVNRQKIDPEYLAIIDQVKDYYRIDVADGLTQPVRVEVPFGIRVRAELPTLTAPWLKQDKPWERDGVMLRRVIHVDGIYRAWYTATVKSKLGVVPSAVNGRPKLDYGVAFSGRCYMESRDGVTWTKPSLGLVEFEGSRDNNIISTDPHVGGAIFLDERAPAEARYKSVSSRRYRSYHQDAPKDFPVVGGAVSPDGLRWTVLPEPVFAIDDGVLGNDQGPEAHRDALTGNYVIFSRANYPRRRSIARIVSSDFRHWQPAANLLTPGPQDDPSEDYYGGAYLTYPGAPSAHLMLVSVYHRDTSGVDIRLASSMDGDAWNWLQPATIVPLGRTGDWNGGMLFAVGEMIRLPDARIAVAINGSASRHEEYWRVLFERGDNDREYETAWACWEDGRIAGIEAEKIGGFTTLVMNYKGGPIEINARTSLTGSIEVDVLTEERPYPRFAVQAQPLSGDLKWQSLEFAGDGLAQLVGKQIRLHFRLCEATVFGVRGADLEWVSSSVRK